MLAHFECRLTFILPARSRKAGLFAVPLAGKQFTELKCLPSFVLQGLALDVLAIIGASIWFGATETALALRYLRRQLNHRFLDCIRLCVAKVNTL